MRRDIEPTFLGVQCTGPDAKRSGRCKESAEAYAILSDFFTLDRRSQLQLAALITEMTTDREDN